MHSFRIKSMQSFMHEASETSQIGFEFPVIQHVTTVPVLQGNEC